MFATFENTSTLRRKNCYIKYKVSWNKIVEKIDILILT